MHTPATNVHVTFDEPAFVAFTVPVAPTSSNVSATLIVGVLSVVMLSVAEAPVSLEASRFGTPMATGAVVSTTIALFAPSEFAAPGEARVSVAEFPTLSAIVPLFSDSDVVPT